MWLEDILYGALASGVNKPTVILLNAALVGCIFVLSCLLALSIRGAPYLIIHVCFLLVLAVGLLLLINWFLTQIGTVRAEDQRKELFSGGQQPAATASEPAASGSNNTKAE